MTLAPDFYRGPTFKNKSIARNVRSAAIANDFACSSSEPGLHRFLNTGAY